MSWRGRAAFGFRLERERLHPEGCLRRRYFPGFDQSLIADASNTVVRMRPTHVSNSSLYSSIRVCQDQQYSLANIVSIMNGRSIKE